MTRELCDCDELIQLILMSRSGLSDSDGTFLDCLSRYKVSVYIKCPSVRGGSIPAMQIPRSGPCRRVRGSAAARGPARPMPGTAAVAGRGQALCNTFEYSDTDIRIIY